MQKILKIDNKDVGFKTSALTVRLYRKHFGRDFIVDINRLRANVSKAGSDEESRLDALDLEIFENVAWIMAKQYDPTIPDIEEWMDGFTTFSVYAILPEILKLWEEETKTTSVPKKA